jgi:hypothetical protein
MSPLFRSAASSQGFSIMRQLESSSRFRPAALAVLLLAAASAEAAVPPAPLTAPAGVTALSGQVMTTEGRPLVNVALRDGAVGTRTDAEGRFLLQNLRSGVSVLTIDGRHAAADGKTDYGLFEVQVQAVAGTTTSLPFTSYLPRIDHAHDVTIPSPTNSEVVVKAASIPGLELHIPPGAIITDTDGKPVTKLGFTSIPLDRTPFPMKGSLDVPAHFTVQPGGATVTGVNGASAGVQIWYPNQRHELPGARATFFRYDPFGSGWTRYGGGVVSTNGSQIVPDKTTLIYDLAGAL